MRLREAVRRHAAPVAGFLVMLIVFGGFAAGMRPSGLATGPTAPALPVAAIDLPAQDADADTYGDDVDLWDGNAVVRLDFELDGLGREGDLLVGTQQDQFRFGEGAELEWRHVVDHDPLGQRPGSDAWASSALRTGLWAHAASWDDGAPPNASATLDVRDDRDVVVVTVEWWDTARDPDALRGRWELAVGREGTSVDGVPIAPGSARLTDGLSVTASLGPDVLDRAAQAVIAERWAPMLRFDAEEAFFPTSGDVLATFHGFARGDPELRTWSHDFNNGRDAYRLLLADFNGDRVIDHRDAALMTDILREGGRARDTVHANVATFGDRVVVQYWFIYPYNFVVDELGDDLPPLGHAGDREFIQLVFDDIGDALDGRPASIAYSQHYGGIVVRDPPAGTAPFHLNDTHPAVYVARGSHASYPVAGSDAALRTAFAGFGDEFDGRGETWTPEDYDLEVLDDEAWHMGYLWGPATRHSRDLGTATRPFLLYDFSYPFTDPFDWQADLMHVAPDRLDDLYGPEDA